jgi:hypothetical protein
MLPLLPHHFTGYYTCSAPILPDIALAIDQFYQVLPLLPHYFTGYYTCSRSILPGVAFAAPSFYWILYLQCTNFTRYCACNRSVLPDVAFACTIILPDIALAGGSVVLTAATTRPLGPAIDRSIGVWETQPIWDNLIAFLICLIWLLSLGYLLPPVPGLASGCASSTTTNWGLQ